MSPGFKLSFLCAVPLLFSWACAPDLDSLSAYYDAGKGGSAGSGAVGDSGAGTTEPASCTNLARDPDESDVDCGGTSDCHRCGTNLHCSGNKDCESGFCKGSRCAAPTCGDGVKNQDETAVDCGGSCAPELGCDVGVACKVNEDCTSEYCKGELCTDHCVSGVREADETDKDCGGSCDKCGDDKRCQEGSDCQSLICINNKCQAATCDDKIQNQDESDKDCGGVCATATDPKPCPISARCNSGADCESYVCSKSKCVADIDVPTGDVIDSFEDGDFLLSSIGGRVGNWYAYGDGSGTDTEEVVSIQRGPDSKHGLHTTGKDFSSWGSGVGVDFNNAGSGQEDKAPYDASAYTGVTFWARAETALMVSVVLPDGDTDAAGDVCTVCDHHWFKPIQVTTDWQRFTVDFSSLSLEPGGDPEPTSFDASRVVSLQFRLSSGQSYEMWLDDVAFVK